jgi:hypothetical protein
MPQKPGVTIRGLEELRAKLGPQLTSQVFRGPTKRAGDRLTTALTTYPEPPKNYKMKFKSAKQRRWFFAALKSGRITVPYRRSLRLARGWVLKFRELATEFRVEVSNKVPYLPYVMGPGTQADIHKGRWQTTAQVGQKVNIAIAGDFTRAIKSWIGS